LLDPYLFIRPPIYLLDPPIYLLDPLFIYLTPYLFIRPPIYLCLPLYLLTKLGAELLCAGLNITKITMSFSAIFTTNKILLYIYTGSYCLIYLQTMATARRRRATTSAWCSLECKPATAGAATHSTVASASVSQLIKKYSSPLTYK